MAAPIPTFASPIHLHLLFLLLLPRLPCIPSNPIILPSLPNKSQNLQTTSFSSTTMSPSTSAPEPLLRHRLRQRALQGQVQLQLGVGGVGELLLLLPTQLLHLLNNRMLFPNLHRQGRDLPTPAAYRNAGQCHVILSYASASASEVSLSGDTFHLQTYVGMVFCCMDSSYSTTPEEDEKNTGLLSMNRGALAGHPYGLPALLLLHLR